jgi:2-C-methyl-D-erythritol 4-phosphate cytidylyltransferase
MSTTVVIPAGGTGSRFGSEIPKQFVELQGKPLIVRTIEIFDNINEVDSIIISVHSEWFTYTKELVQKFKLSKVKDVVVGGKERQDSIFNALHSKAIEDAEIVMIHDAVRPFLSENLIHKIIDSAEENGAVVLGSTPKDPVKEINGKGQVVRSLPRNHLTITQTPQAFWTDIIVNAYEKARVVNYTGADSSQLVEFNGFKVTVIEGEDQNIKITTPFDFKLAELIMNEKNKQL